MRHSNIENAASSRDQKTPAFISNLASELAVHVADLIRSEQPSNQVFLNVLFKKHFNSFIFDELFFL